jgi:hypothetical protein
MHLSSIDAFAFHGLGVNWVRPLLIEFVLSTAIWAQPGLNRLVLLLAARWFFILTFQI